MVIYIYITTTVTVTPTMEASQLLASKRRLLEHDDYLSHKKSKHSREDTEKSHKRKKEKKSKKSKKKSKKKHKHSSESSDSNSDDNWVEKSAPPDIKNTLPKEVIRDDWMNMTGAFKTFTRDDLKIENPPEKKKTLENMYDPTKSSRELNPYWKNDGTGLPSEYKRDSRDTKYSMDNNRDKQSKFKKPMFDTRQSSESYSKDYKSSSTSRSWQKSSKTILSNEEIELDMPNSPNVGEINLVEVKVENNLYLSDEQMNKLGSKIVKAEIMGNTKLVAELKEELDTAREYRKTHPKAAAAHENNAVMLTLTDAKGNMRPLNKTHSDKHKGGKRNAETHSASGDRMRFFSDDDNHSLQDMFQKERFGDGYDDDKEFSKVLSKHKNPNDDLEDIFASSISKNKSAENVNEKMKMKAISQHNKMQRSLENCIYCVDSTRMNKRMIVSMGTKSYVALPERKSLVDGHCIISTLYHLPCAVMADEDVWSEIMTYRKVITNMFNARNEDVIFFETVTHLHRHPHLVINCIPLPRDACDSIAIYFKKALLECETEWSNNKKVIDLKGKDIRRGVPKGLPYFWVDFGMQSGYAHIIEDQQLFPRNFAEEIVGGILDLDHNLWKKPSRENFEVLSKKLKRFSEIWKPFDPITNS